MKIEELFNLSSYDSNAFANQLAEDIKKMQNDGQEVEVQYKVNSHPNGEIIYSALLLGRK